MERNLLGTQAFDDSLSGILGYYDDTTKEYSAIKLLTASSNKNYLDVYDLKLTTIWGCLWLKFDVGDISWMLVPDACPEDSGSWRPK